MKVQLLVVIVSMLVGAISWAQQAPDCDGFNGQPFGVNNDEVLQWKTSTPNLFKARAHIQGVITNLFADATGHSHFQAQIGPNTTDTIEVIYNEGFGAVSSSTTFQLGMSVEACGDYITSTEPTQYYPASPDGAIIHWVHNSPNVARHPSGYMMVNGVLYGEGTEAPRRGY